jgi:hypothetical protein
MGAIDGERFPVQQDMGSQLCFVDHFAASFLSAALVCLHSTSFYEHLVAGLHHLGTRNAISVD